MQNQKIPTPKHLILQKITKVNGQVSVKQYQRCRLLGTGGFAQCYLVKSTETGAEFAMKIVAKELLMNSKARYKLENEIRIHKTLRHQGIVRMYNSFEDQNYVYMLLELCENQSLNQLLLRKKRLSVSQTQHHLRSLLPTISHLHSRNILHRDLKLGNIFLQNSSTKLGDFGLATKLEFKGEKKRSLCGTPNYIAPEVIKVQGYDHMVDIWSLGVLVFTMLTGTPPFETESIGETYELIKKAAYTFPMGVPGSARELIRRILNVNPKERPSLEEIMESEFMREGCGLRDITSLVGNRTVCEEQNVEINKKYNKIVNTVQYFSVNKDGFVYVMSNGVVGCNCKQNTVLYNPNNDSYYLLTQSPNTRDTLTKTPQQSLPSLSLTVLQKLLTRSKPQPQQLSSSSSPLVYIKKHIEYPDLSIFRLSNNTIQLKFLDGCQALMNKQMELTLCTQGKVVGKGEYSEVVGMKHPRFSGKVKYLELMLGLVSRHKKGRD